MFLIVFTAKFVVHTNPQGAVSLQNKKSPHYWLAIKNGGIQGNVSLYETTPAYNRLTCLLQGRGGPYCQFNVIDHGVCVCVCVCVCTCSRVLNYVH